MAEKKGARGGKDKGPGPDDIMDPKELRPILAQAKRGNPATCSIALTKDREGVILADKRKKPKKLLSEMKKQAEKIGLELETTSLRFGRAVVNEDDATLLSIVVNKDAPSAMRPRLLEQIKKAGFAHLEITVSIELETESEEEEQPKAPAAGAAPAGSAGTAPAAATGAGASDAPAATASADTTGTAPAQPQPAQPQSSGRGASREAGAGADLQALAKTLTDVVREMIAAVTQNPAEKPNLMGLATAAQTSLKRGDAHGTQAGIEALRNGIARAKSAPANGNGSARQAPTPSPAIAKARQAWIATRQKVDTDIGNLHNAFTSAFKGHGRHGDITKAFRARVDTVLGKLDEALAHKLDAVNQATDHGKRAKLVEEAHALIADYTKHVATDPTISELDRNPFVPLSIQKTMTTTLAALSRAIR